LYFKVQWGENKPKNSSSLTIELRHSSQKYYTAEKHDYSAQPAWDYSNPLNTNKRDGKDKENME
jgi:hypothetical protein